MNEFKKFGARTIFLPSEESTDDGEDEGFLPSLGIVTSIVVIGIIGWLRRYN